MTTPIPYAASRRRATGTVPPPQQQPRPGPIIDLQRAAGRRWQPPEPTGPTVTTALRHMRERRYSFEYGRDVGYLDGYAEAMRIKVRRTRIRCVLLGIALATIVIFGVRCGFGFAADGGTHRPLPQRQHTAAAPQVHT